MVVMHDVCYSFGIAVVTYVICRVTPDIGLSKVSCVSAELLADQRVRFEVLAKLSARYETIQSVTKKCIVAVAPNCYSTVYFADCRFRFRFVVCTGSLVDSTWASDSISDTNSWNSGLSCIYWALGSRRALSGCLDLRSSFAVCDFT